MQDNLSPRVWIVPTVVDTDRFVPTRRAVVPSETPAETITIVWMGLAYNLKYLNVLAPALRALQSRFHMNLRVVCSRPPRMPGVNVEFRSWEHATGSVGPAGCVDRCHAAGGYRMGAREVRVEAVAVYGCWHACSCLAGGGQRRHHHERATTGCSPPPSRSGTTALNRSAGNPSCVVQIGLAGRRTVEERYSLSVWGPRLAEVYRTLRPGRTGPWWTGAT